MPERDQTQEHRPLGWGEAVPWFTVRADCNPRFSFNTAAGRYAVLFFFQSAAMPESRRALDAFLAARQRFDGWNAAFFGVTVDPEDERAERLTGGSGAFRYFFDFDRAVSLLYGACNDVAPDAAYRRWIYVLDERFRVVARLGLDRPPEEQVARALRVLDSLPRLHPAPQPQPQWHAPVLIVPNVFEPALCRALVQFYDRAGGEPSGFMRDVDGKTRLVHDAEHKVRRDREITDQTLRGSAMACIHGRLVPEIAKAFQYQVTRIERHIVACYDSSERGHFRPHRDNTTKGTAHRRFAVTLNLNAGEYDGGGLRFPEFGPQVYLPPTGAALVFSCSLLHEATDVTRGRRYAYLPFLYDDAAAAVRTANLGFLAPGPASEPAGAADS